MVASLLSPAPCSGPDSCMARRIYVAARCTDQTGLSILDLVHASGFQLGGLLRSGPLHRSAWCWAACCCEWCAGLSWPAVVISAVDCSCLPTLRPSIGPLRRISTVASVPRLADGGHGGGLLPTWGAAVAGLGVPLKSCCQRRWALFRRVGEPHGVADGCHGCGFLPSRRTMARGG